MARSRVELFEEIRKAHDREELGIRALANRFGVHRRAVRQALASPIPPPRKSSLRPSPALDPWKATIDRWLLEDESAPRKQRHTARRVFERLVEELGANVGESTVRRYVAQAKRDQPVSISKVSVPQSHPAGEEILCGIPHRDSSPVGRRCVARPVRTRHRGQLTSGCGFRRSRIYLSNAQRYRRPRPSSVYRPAPRPARGFGSSKICRDVDSSTPQTSRIR